jgi:type III secretory pathway component EscU
MVPHEVAAGVEWGDGIPHIHTMVQSPLPQALLRVGTMVEERVAASVEVVAVAAQVVTSRCHVSQSGEIIVIKIKM